MSHEIPRFRGFQATLSNAVSGDHALWGVTMLAFALDVLTTLYGLGQGLTELNPVVLALMPTLGAVGSLLFLKLVVVAVAVGAWTTLPARYRASIPIGVAVPWGVAGLMNVQLILATTVR
ncbi:hypothetical protein C440_01440 [Haloferax mucosum ATCC BAA-1512]|uniref:Uncharacterized protein n=1 Tax=Haloferax mucosum ATCC BAA-1512 TaxID=662479 RepID=M0IT52_9EURY|nr:DUF5658 family protein [Haloferax mucosum]ELZ98978.1 hypothetical protein C440_01440 [Haloferax mucosum ATCC BAA-1512]